MGNLTLDSNITNYFKSQLYAIPRLRKREKAEGEERKGAEKRNKTKGSNLQREGETTLGRIFLKDTYQSRGTFRLIIIAAQMRVAFAPCRCRGTHGMSQLIFMTAPGGRYHYYPCFSDKETEV